MVSKNRRYLDVLLGVFVAGAFGLLVVIVFLIGQERRLFEQGTYVNARFPNVAGLAVGAPVMLAGVYVGHVSSIQFPTMSMKAKADERGRITVVMRVSKDMMPWIRQDSIARVDAKGLLGDKIINVSLGSPEFPAIPPNGMLQSIAPIDFNEALSKAQDVLQNVTEAVSSARKFIEGFQSKGGDSALAGTAQSMRNMAQAVETGDGVLHQLIYDKRSGTDLRTALAGLSSSLTEAHAILAKIDRIAGQAENGKGLVHALVYDPEGEKVVRSAKDVLAEVETVLKDARTGPGMLHDLIYSTAPKDLIANLNTASADLKSILARVNNGEGTFGRLLVDTSVYEDLKLILSTVRRNEILKALVRFAISKKERDSAGKPQE